MSAAKDWTPGWATHPGEHLAEQIESQGWSLDEFAHRAGLPADVANAIIAGRSSVTPETAVKLERVLGLKAQVWTNLQANWDYAQRRATSKKVAAGE